MTCVYANAKHMSDVPIRNASPICMSKKLISYACPMHGGPRGQFAELAKKASATYIPERKSVVIRGWVRVCHM